MSDATMAAPLRIAGRRPSYFDPGNWILNLLTLAFAAIWFFPVYWALATSFKTDDEAVRKGVNLLPESLHIDGYAFVIQNSDLPIWYVNSVITSVSVTVLAVFMAACAGYAISQLRFPGSKVLWYLILASFMVPVSALMLTPLTTTVGAAVSVLMTRLGFALACRFPAASSTYTE